MKAVILAGGLGMRLRPFTEVIPKPLLPIGEKAVLEIQIERLKQHGFDEIFVATNYKSDYVESFLGGGSRYGVRLYISREEKPLGTAGPLTLLRDRLDEPFMVMNGDILTIAVKKEILPFAFGNIFFDGDYVTGIEEKPDIITYVLAGIYVMRPEIFDRIPYNEFYNMDVLIKSMLNDSLPVSKYEMQEYWLDIGRIDDFTKAEEIYHNHFKTNAKL
jgi:NDP-sugar pyrophosphorylase family protein